MKSSHELVVNYISKAISSCGDDEVLVKVKKHLIQALNVIQNHTEKKIKNQEATKKYIEEAKKKNDIWMDSLKKGLEKLLEGESDDKGTINQ